MNLINPDQILFEEISAMIEQTKRTIYTQANRESVLLFWNIGRRINDDVLLNKRADYGKQIVVSLSRQLVAEYWTTLPPRVEFERKIHTILSETRERISRRQLLFLDTEQSVDM